MAASQGHVDLVRLLLATRGINPNLGMLGEKTTPLIIAAYKGHEEVVKVLLTASSVRINLRQADGSTALFAATQANFPGDCRSACQTRRRRKTDIIRWNTASVLRSV